MNYVWYLSVAVKSKTPEACFAFADGSNSFLKVSSHSGGIDVYVGDGGSAKLHSQKGKRTVSEVYSPYESQFSVLLSDTNFLCLSLILLLYVGGVCVRVPSSLKAGVELCGTSVDISPEVVLHGVENNTTEGQTTVTGETLFFFHYITLHGTVI